MAIAQIQTAQTLNPLERILNSGGQAITQILDQAVQMGRDRVNNQYRQDAVLTQNMQLAQGLSQRRAQDLDARMTDRRNFDYRAGQDALNLGLRQEQMGMAREQQMFNRGMDEQKFGFAQEQAAIGNEQRDRQLDATIANQNTDNALQGGVLDLNRRKLEMEERILNNPQLKPPTTAAQSLEYRKEKDAQTAAQKQLEEQNKIDVADNAAFPNQRLAAAAKVQSYMAANPEAKEADAIASFDPQTQAVLNNKDYDQGQVELAAINNYPTEDAYVAAAGTKLTPAAEKRRREFYRRNKGQATQPGVEVLPDPVENFLNF